MFTKNCREAVRSMSFGRRKRSTILSRDSTASLSGFLRYIYEKTRLPLVPIYGIFPVKMV